VNATEGLPPLAVEFTNESSGEITGWWWDFGDNTQSFDQNPVHTYSEAGVYSVTLTVHNAFQRNAVRLQDLVTAGSAPIPEFSSDVRSGPAPLAVQFFDESGGYPMEWAWDFGDGEVSFEQNPFHVYSAPGIYTVQFTAENKWGNATIRKEDFIIVVEGVSHECILPDQGVTTEYMDGSWFMTLNGSEFLSCGFDPLEDASVIEGIPDCSSGISRILFYSSDEGGFSRIGNDTFQGNLSRLVLTSISDSASDQEDPWSYNYSLELPEYTAGGMIRSILWRNVTPEDLESFHATIFNYNYDVISGVAYTLLFQEENIYGTGEADLVFGVDSSWLEAHGWRPPVLMESDPAGADVYIDSAYAGVTPMYLDDDLSPGVHEIVMVMPGYYNISTNVTLGDTHDSVHLIRIPEYGEGTVLNTTFLFHDPATNLDYYQAHSPDGLSRFGVAVLEQSGNPLQLIYLSLSKMFRGSEGVSSPASTGGGGSGGGTGGSVGSSAGTGPTAVQTIAEAPAGEPTVAPAAVEKDIKSSVRAELFQPTEVSTTAAVPPQPPAIPEFGLVPLTIVKNLSVVFVAVLVAVLFYIRWKKGGSEE
jgi:PKD repeat protein